MPTPELSSHECNRTIWHPQKLPRCPLMPLPIRPIDQGARSEACVKGRVHHEPGTLAGTNVPRAGVVQGDALAFIPQAKSEATDASAVGGDTDEPKQFVSPFLSFRRHSSEGTRGSTTVLPTTLPYKGRISLESSRSGIPGVIFPVTSADCLIGCEVASSPISSSSGRNSNANAEWMLSPRASQ